MDIGFARVNDIGIACSDICQTNCEQLFARHTFDHEIKGFTEPMLTVLDTIGIDVVLIASDTAGSNSGGTGFFTNIVNQFEQCAIRQNGESITIAS